MPFYEYECQACKFYAEVMQKISDAPLIKCPSCGKRRLKKLVSAPVFRLKGGGWYETDFKSDKENKRNLLGADKEESKAEVKPDAKPDSKEGKAEAKEGPPGKDAKAVEPKPAPAAARRTVSAPARPARTARKAARTGRGRRRGRR
jgi:putative FmdB family regulatory protein